MSLNSPSPKENATGPRANVSLQVVSDLLGDKRYRLVADAIRESQGAARRSVEPDSEFDDAFRDWVIEFILMRVVAHLDFLDRFGDVEPHSDASGTFHGRADDFFTVWLSLGGFGISYDSLETVTNRSQIGSSVNPPDETPDDTP